MARRAFKSYSNTGATQRSNRGYAAPRDQQRIDILLQHMDIAALDVLVCRLPQNVLMLAGCWPATGNSLVVFPRLGEPVLIVPLEEIHFANGSWIGDIRSFEIPISGAVEDTVQHIMADIARDKGLQKLVIGYEATPEDVSSSRSLLSAPGRATYQMLRSAFPAADFHDASDMLDAAQMVKTPREVAAIKTAAQIAHFGLRAADGSIAVGIRESEILSLIHKEILAKGIGFKGTHDIQVFSRAISSPRSAEAYLPLLSTSDREVRPGDTILVEIEVCASGFWSKLARTFIVGSPLARVQEAYDVCLDAQRKAVEAIGNGVKAGEIDTAVRNYVAKRGYGEEFKTQLGHGIGFTVSPKSRPRFRADSEDILRPYVVHTLEPALFIDGLTGIKVGDVVADLGQGVEFFQDKDP